MIFLASSRFFSLLSLSSALINTQRGLGPSLPRCLEEGQGTHLFPIFDIVLHLLATEGLLCILHLRLRDHRPPLRKTKSESLRAREAQLLLHSLTFVEDLCYSMQFLYIRHVIDVFPQGNTGLNKSRSLIFKCKRKKHCLTLFLRQGPESVYCIHRSSTKNLKKKPCSCSSNRNHCIT